MPRIEKAAVAVVAERIEAGTPAAIHDLADCEYWLTAEPDYNANAGTPERFACKCGRRFVHIEDEAEGGYWGVVE